MNFKPGDFVVRFSEIDNDKFTIFAIQKVQNGKNCKYYYTCEIIHGYGSRYISITDTTENQYVKLSDYPDLFDMHVEYLI